MDSAFFSDAIITSLDAQGVEYTVSVPFERFGELKERIEARRWWHRIEAGCAYFEARWKPKAWNVRHRFLFLRTWVNQLHKDPVQLDLFIPQAYGYEFKVILTNKSLRARKVLAFHNGRGSQEGIFAELKSDNQLDYVPTRTWVGNQIYLLSVLKTLYLTYAGLVIIGILVWSVGVLYFTPGNRIVKAGNRQESYSAVLVGEYAVVDVFDIRDGKLAPNCENSTCKTDVVFSNGKATLIDRVTGKPIDPKKNYRSTKNILFSIWGRNL